MNSRERIRALIAGETADHCGFWLGNPHVDTWPILHKYFGTNTEEALRQKLGDDFRQISPRLFTDTYQDPDGKEYGQLATKFNPVRFNAKEWVQVAKEAGMKWMVVTAKHQMVSAC